MYVFKQHNIYNLSRLQIEQMIDKDRKMERYKDRLIYGGYKDRLIKRQKVRKLEKIQYDSKLN